MKITVDTKEKTVQFQDAFTFEDIKYLQSFLPDFANWKVIPYIKTDVIREKSYDNDWKKWINPNPSTTPPYLYCDTKQVSVTEADLNALIKAQQPSLKGDYGVSNSCIKENIKYPNGDIMLATNYDKQHLNPQTM